MAHPSEGVLQAFIDGELAADERARVSAHLEQCADCRSEVEQLSVAAAAFAGAVGAYGALADLPRARAAIQSRTAAARRPRMLRLIPREHTRVTAVRRALLRAAVLVLIAAGAVSAAVPGSPVRRFFVNLWQQTSRLFVASRPAAPAVRHPLAPTSVPAPAPPAGVSVLPLDGQITVLVHAPAPGLRVHVRVVDTDRASVEASGPATTAHFRTAPGRIEVTGGGAGDLRVGIPRAATRAAVDVDGKPLFSKSGDLLRRLAPAETTSGEAVFELHP